MRNESKREANKGGKEYVQEFRKEGKSYYPMKDGVADMGRPVKDIKKWCESVGNDNDMVIKGRVVR